MANDLKFKGRVLKFFGTKKPIDFDLNYTRNILFFRYDRIGDMVITTPVFRELKLAYPKIKITVLASKVNRDVIRNNPYVDQIMTNYKNSLFLDFVTLVRLRIKKFDVCVEFDHSVVPHAIIRLNLIKPKKVISIKKDGRYGVKGSELSLYDIYIDKPNKIHFRDIWMGVLEPFNVIPKSNNFDLFINNQHLTQAKNFIKKYSSKFVIGINLEGAVKGKKIRYHELLKICEGLYDQEKNIQIIILSTPKKIQDISQKVKSMALHYVDISYKTDSILQVGALINELDLIITPDTSIVHIASVFNKPVVTIHENNRDSYDLFAPTSKLNRTVFSKSKNNLDDFSLVMLINYCIELINQIKKSRQ